MGDWVSACRQLATRIALASIVHGLVGCADDGGQAESVSREDIPRLYWQWQVETPVDIGPFSADDCLRQTQPLPEGPYILSGASSFGSPRKTCDVPAGTTLVVPVLANMVYRGPDDDLELLTDEGLRMSVEANIDSVDMSVSGSLDGRSIDIDLDDILIFAPEPFPMLSPSDEEDWAFENIGPITAEEAASSGGRLREGDPRPAIGAGWFLELDRLDPGDYGLTLEVDIQSPFVERFTVDLAISVL